MKQLFINKKATIKDALLKISKSGHRCLLVTDNLEKMLGTISDGDLRRAILKNQNLGQKIDKIYKKNPRFFYSKNYNLKKVKELFIKHKLDLIPVLDKTKKVEKIIFWNDIFKKKKSENEKKTNIVIMSGGEGKRLLPFTKVLPKPLIPLNDKPIISHIIDSFENQGFKNINVIVNYKADLLNTYMSNYQKKSKIKIFKEKNPLGTVGGLYLLKNKVNDNFILTNCDILTADLQYEEILNFHKKYNYDLTLVASLRNFSIPYGVCEINKNTSLSKIKEKPKFNFLVSIGMYVMNKKVLSSIKNNSKLDITNLIKRLKNKKYKIGVFPIDDKSWIDVGNWSDYNQAVIKDER